jgi:hypothetical protein
VRGEQVGGYADSDDVPMPHKDEADRIADGLSREMPAEFATRESARSMFYGYLDKLRDEPLVLAEWFERKAAELNPSP